MKRRKNKPASPFPPNPKRPRQSKPALTPSSMILDPKQPQQNSKHHERDSAVPSVLSLKLIGSKPKKPVHCPEQKRRVPQLFLENESKRPTLKVPGPFRASATSTKGQNQTRSSPSLLSLQLGNITICPAMNINFWFLGGVSLLRMFTTTRPHGNINRITWLGISRYF